MGVDSNPVARVALTEEEDHWDEECDGRAAAADESDQAEVLRVAVEIVAEQDVAGVTQADEDGEVGEMSAAARRRRSVDDGDAAVAWPVGDVEVPVDAPTRRLTRRRFVGIEPDLNWFVVGELCRNLPFPRIWVNSDCLKMIFQGLRMLSKLLWIWKIVWLDTPWENTCCTGKKYCYYPSFFIKIDASEWQQIQKSKCPM